MVHGTCAGRSAHRTYGEGVVVLFLVPPASCRTMTSWHHYLKSLERLVSRRHERYPGGHQFRLRKRCGPHPLPPLPITGEGVIRRTREPLSQ